MTENEVAALLDTCLSHPDEAACDAMILQLLTGLTVPELCGLTVGDWQRGRAVSWIEVTKAYKQVRGQKPVMTKLLDDANSYRKVVCTGEIEQVLHRLVARCKRQSRGRPRRPADCGCGRHTSVTATIQGGGAGCAGQDHPGWRPAVLCGAGWYLAGGKPADYGSHGPAAQHRGLLLTRGMPLQLTRSGLPSWGFIRSIRLGLSMWTGEMSRSCCSCRGKLARWHSRILHTTEEIQLGQSGCQLLIRAQPESHLTVCSRHGVIGTIKKREEL